MRSGTGRSARSGEAGRVGGASHNPLTARGARQWRAGLACSFFFVVFVLACSSACCRFFSACFLALFSASTRSSCFRFSLSESSLSLSLSELSAAWTDGYDVCIRADAAGGVPRCVVHQRESVSAEDARRGPIGPASHCWIFCAAPGSSGLSSADLFDCRASGALVSSAESCAELWRCSTTKRPRVTHRAGQRRGAPKHHALGTPSSPPPAREHGELR